MATNSKDFSKLSRSTSLPTENKDTNNYPQSPAEHYVADRAQYSSNAKVSPTKDILSPESRRLVTFEQRMNQWRRDQCKEICRREKYRYSYSPSRSLSSKSNDQSEFHKGTTNRKERK